MHMLHWHIIMPFIMQQTLHMLPAIILHICCKVAAAISSSHRQVIFMPPAHFSIFIVQRGTMHIRAMSGKDPTPGCCMLAPMVDIIAPRSIITVFISVAPSSVTLWHPAIGMAAAR